ncbi:MAG: tRNA-(ms[2]io[6]A)-hydroxylase [Acidobacteria bacterium]|nr:tRNA-(ms[2]io[6]A)-hydroxylase [Acidobacteriota bacterium]
MDTIAAKEKRSPFGDRGGMGDVVEMRLRKKTPETWARDVIAHLPEFLADHASCELQASVFALSLVGSYPEDQRLVDVLSALAAEELRHFRKAVRECRRAGATVKTRRKNPYVARLRQGCQSRNEPARAVELLVTAAIIEMRSHERFTALLPLLPDGRLKRFYEELARAEERHGPAYLDLAQARGGQALVESTLERLLDIEDEAVTDSGGSRDIAVHSPMPARGTAGEN